MLTLDILTELGYNAKELAPRVYKISNFATPDETAELFNEATSYTEEDWKIHYYAEMRKNCMLKFGRDDIENLVKEGLLEVTDSWEDKNIYVQSRDIVKKLDERATEIFDRVGELAVTGFNVFQRLYEGTHLVSHYDQYSDKLVQYAAVLYLNDDYAEGELFFPRLNLHHVRPAPGDLVLFPGTSEFEHGVTHVAAGPVRYVIPVFIKAKHPDGSMAGWGDFG